MKCGHYVKWQTRREKGSGAEYQKATDHRAVMHFADKHEELLASGFVVCDGNIKCVSLEAVDEPDWGDHYAKLNIEYACDKCGISFGAEIPEPIALVNRALDSIDDTERDALRAEWWRIQNMSIEERVAEARAKAKEK